MFTLLLQPKLNTALMSWLEFVYFLHRPHGYANGSNHCRAQQVEARGALSDLGEEGGARLFARALPAVPVEPGRKVT